MKPPPPLTVVLWPWLSCQRQRPYQTSQDGETMSMECLGSGKQGELGFCVQQSRGHLYLVRVRHDWVAFTHTCTLVWDSDKMCTEDDSDQHHFL